MKTHPARGSQNQIILLVNLADILYWKSLDYTQETSCFSAIHENIMYITMIHNHKHKKCPSLCTLIDTHGSRRVHSSSGRRTISFGGGVAIILGLMGLWGWEDPLYTLVPGPGGLYLPQNEANIWPMESNIGVIWTTKSDFLHKYGVPFTVSDDIEYAVFCIVWHGEGYTQFS